MNTTEGSWKAISGVLKRVKRTLCFLRKAFLRRVKISRMGIGEIVQVIRLMP